MDAVEAFLPIFLLRALDLKLTASDSSNFFDALSIERDFCDWKEKSLLDKVLQWTHPPLPYRAYYMSCMGLTCPSRSTSVLWLILDF